MSRTPSQAPASGVSPSPAERAAATVFGDRSAAPTGDVDELQRAPAATTPAAPHSPVQDPIAALPRAVGQSVSVDMPLSTETATLHHPDPGMGAPARQPASATESWGEVLAALHADLVEIGKAINSNGARLDDITTAVQRLSSHGQALAAQLRRRSDAAHRRPTTSNGDPAMDTTAPSSEMPPPPIDISTAASLALAATAPSGDATAPPRVGPILGVLPLVQRVVERDGEFYLAVDWSTSGWVWIGDRRMVADVIAALHGALAAPASSSDGAGS